MQKNDNSKGRKPWPADCIWPKPIPDGEGQLWDIDDAEMVELDEEGWCLQEIKAYFDGLAEEGVLNDDYSLCEDYRNDDSDEPAIRLEMGDEYWDNGFLIDMWQEDISDHINRFKLDISEAHPESVIREIIGYDFINENLLRQAFTRRAFAIEYGLSGDNEQLEFLGDSILGAVVTKEIADALTEVDVYETDAPFTAKYDEGELTRIRSKFVSKEYLAARAQELSLDRFILYGSGETATESSREDMMEALIGAVAVDSCWNMSVIGSVVDRLLCIQLDDPAMLLRRSFYETFNTWHMKRFGTRPDYTVDGLSQYSCVLRYSIPENDKNIWTRQIATGQGNTRSAAREMAAEMAYRFVVQHGLWINIKDSGIEPNLEDSINQLQELYQKKYLEALPEYSFEEFPQGTWHCECICCDVAGWRTGSSKIKAKKEAAYHVLKKLAKLGQTPDGSVSRDGSC